MLKNSSTYLWVYLTFFAFGLLFYLGTQEGRLSSDFYNWVYDYEHGSFLDALKCFGYPGLHQMYHIPFYTAYKLLGLHAWGWHFLFVGIHALNALLVFLFTKRLLQTINKNTTIAFVPAFMFLLSPYQTEVVSWGACIHYLLMCTFLLASLIYLFDYLKLKTRKHLMAFLLFYILALFCMEQSYLFPFIYLTFGIVLYKQFSLSKKKHFKHILIAFDNFYWVFTINESIYRAVYRALWCIFPFAF
ncbi:MAG: hypothetical protein LRY27_01670 [Chitinophagales bacterium]|nr:hypothetical protein [Chitinophagales bacterium]